MSSRPILPAVSAETEKGLLYPALLVELEFDSAPVRMWSGIGDLVWNGKTFQGAGQFGRIAGATETTELRAVGRTMELSGIDPAIAALALGEDYQDRPARTWLALLDANGLVIPDPVLLFDDTMDTMTIRDSAATASIQLAVESELTGLLQASERRYTDLDQKIDHPEDKFFEYVAALEEKELLWGVGGSFSRRGPPLPRDKRDR